MAGQQRDAIDLALHGMRRAPRHRRAGKWAALEIAALLRRAFRGVVAAASGGRMTDFFKIDQQKLATPGADLGAGARVDVPPGTDAIQAGLIGDARIGKYTVRFLFAIVDGVPRSATLWSPEKPKRLKPATLKKYRRERLAFAKEIAEEFGLPLRIIDRMGGVPRITEQIYEDGVVEPVDLPVPRPEGVH
jgi:hypothetical protein